MFMSDCMKDFIATKKKAYEHYRTLLENLGENDEETILSALHEMEDAVLYIRYCLYPEFITACEEDILYKLPYEKNSKGIVLLKENSSAEVKKAYWALVLSLCEVLIQRDKKPDDYIIMSRDDSSKVSAMYENNLKKLPKWLRKN